MPDSFEDGLRKLGAKVDLTRRFADHHRFSTRDILQFVDRCGLTPGTKLIVETRDDIAGAIVVKPEAGPAATLGTVAARKILVESIR